MLDVTLNEVVMSPRGDFLRHVWHPSPLELSRVEVPVSTSCSDGRPMWITTLCLGLPLGTADLHGSVGSSKLSRRTRSTPNTITTCIYGFSSYRVSGLYIS